MAQVEMLEAAADRAQAGGVPDEAPVIRRASYVLAVAALDMYVHEAALALLVEAAAQSGDCASRVADYLRDVTAGEVTGEMALAHVRYRLSYKTLVAPRAIDSLLLTSGRDSEATWKSMALLLGDRPERLRRTIELVYDRRNQIAHEGDWDHVNREFRRMEKVTLEECVTAVKRTAQSLEAVLA